MQTFEESKTNKTQEICLRARSEFRSSPSNEYIMNLARTLESEGYIPEMTKELMEKAPKYFSQYPSIAECLELGINLNLKAKYLKIPEPTLIHETPRESPWPIAVEVLMRQRIGTLTGRSQRYLLSKLRLSEQEILKLQKVYVTQEWENPEAMEILKRIAAPAEEALSEVTHGIAKEP